MIYGLYIYIYEYMYIYIYIIYNVILDYNIAYKAKTFVTNAFQSPDVMALSNGRNVNSLLCFA